ncbi:60S acidic ribosomal protein P2 [Podila minutissima]|nr:60S acidic ribosomal protein P2 [Podila minutissima]
MKYIAAYHLLTIGGNAAPTDVDIITLLATVSIAAESERVEAVVAQLAGKDVDELISEGASKLASIPSDDAVDSVVTPAVTPADKEEVKEGDDCEEIDDYALEFGLFD